MKYLTTILIAFLMLTSTGYGKDKTPTPVPTPAPVAQPAPVQEVIPTVDELKDYKLDDKSRQVISWQQKDLQRQWNDLMVQDSNLSKDEQAIVDGLAKTHNVDMNTHVWDPITMRFMPVPPKAPVTKEVR